MTGKIRIGIAGYGNLGRGAELAVQQNRDMELIAVFTRRDPKLINVNTSTTKVLPLAQAEKMINEIDVMILCSGSAKDLPQQGPYLAQMFNTVDSFDTHAKIPEYFEAVDKAAQKGKKTGIISIGWDPGLFSLQRMLADAVLPQGKEYTFWGRGVSQGHSDAIRKVPGVKYGVQYTIPKEDAVTRVRKGETPELSARDKHLRQCFVVAEEGADKDKIAAAIKSMPNYFAEYETHVFFITEEQFKQDHVKMPHGGFVLRNGVTGIKQEHKQLMEFSLKLESNPEFTASVLVAYARAAYRLQQEGQYGAKTIFDIPLAYISPRSPEDLRKEFL